MLISFQFSNFMSFRDKTNFTMVASRELQHKEHLTIVPSLNLKVLPAAALYGGNGSGKSNFYIALEFASSFILKSKISEDDLINVEPFRLDEKFEKAPSTFTFEILIGRSEEHTSELQSLRHL